MFRKITYTSLVTMPLLVYFVASTPKCSDSVLKSCMKELKEFTGNQDLAFAQTEQDLSITCGHLQEGMQCVNNFTRRCFDATRRELYRTLTSGTQQLMEDLCTQDSDFRKQYLEHAGCFKSVSADSKMCVNSYNRQLESAKKIEMPVTDILRKSCCLFDAYKACTRQAVLLKCSEEAADFSEQIVMKTGGPLAQTHCMSFKHDSKDCEFPISNSRSSIVPPASYAFNMFVSLILLAAFHFHMSHR